MVNLDFNNIRPMNGSANDGFEEFVCQLARREEIPCTKEFVRNGKPDGGVECYKILEDGSEVGQSGSLYHDLYEARGGENLPCRIGRKPAPGGKPGWQNLSRVKSKLWRSFCTGSGAG